MLSISSIEGVQVGPRNKELGSAGGAKVMECRVLRSVITIHNNGMGESFASIQGAPERQLCAGTGAPWAILTVDTDWLGLVNRLGGAPIGDN